MNYQVIEEEDGIRIVSPSGSEDFYPIKTGNGRPPFGYDVTDGRVIPNKNIVLLISQTLDAISTGTSYREGSDFLNNEAKKFNYAKEVTHAGLRLIYQAHRGTDRDGTNFKGRPHKKAKGEELRRQKLARKIAAEKRKATFAQKRAEKLEAKILPQEPLPTPAIIEISRLESEELIEDATKEETRPVLFKPNPGPQYEFLSAPEFQVLFGGAAGGGKSYALIADPIRYFPNPNFRGLLLRRTLDELKEIRWEMDKLYPKIFPEGHPNEARWSEKAGEWRFKNGGTLWLAYLDRDDDVKRYHGQSFTWVGFDELTYWPSPYAWDFLTTRVRTTDPELKKCLAMRATTNPGGPGHGWVKRMFIDPAPPGEPFWATNIETGETMVDPHHGTPLFKRRFIPSRLSDNPYLADDGIYRRNLLAQGNERKIAQLLEGDWSIADGAAFPEFRTAIHVIEPFEIPHSWFRFRSMDWGYQSSHAVHWYAVDPMDNQIVVYREFYGGGKTAKEMAHLVRYLERDERVSYGMLDSSVWHKRGEGPSPAEEMISYGCRWRPADRSQGSRIAGKNMLHQLLRVNEETNRPGIVFFDTCRHIISDLQVAPADPNGGDDIDERYRQRNHAYDSIRYGIMSRPRATSIFDFTNTGPIAPVADRVFGY